MGRSEWLPIFWLTFASCGAIAVTYAAGAAWLPLREYLLAERSQMNARPIAR